uniref:SUN domain-containing protein n=1 Tax=Glossina brevipalpis TaxID=37001 RepID=A0A1A9WM17_9MUSC
MFIQILTNFVSCEFKKIKTNLTMFLIFFWIIWFSQILAISTMFLSLPDINEIPTATVTELPIEVLPSIKPLGSVIVNNEQNEIIADDRANQTADIVEGSSQETLKDEQIVKINDSGGGIETILDTPSGTQEISPNDFENIPINQMNDSSTDVNLSKAQAKPDIIEQQNISQTVVKLNQVNLSTEEIPIPVFSEWTQKQMEAAEKQALEQEQTFNNSAQRKNNTSNNGKIPLMKIRSKNYASPDCGAKIIASNADASNTGAVLSSSKDEYMLSPCGNRIWFVVELCEAIQAQRIDLANFELFSSSPKNFTVAVSNRFPSRDWSNVGRFIAEDKRTVQSFELHPHLFGKFVRVDIHSHYSKEHFCPVSLFRVFGTSEFEAFETENHLNDELDDFDDDYLLEQAHNKNSENNLFKSASDAVLSIVKKAAEVLVKPTNNENQTVNVRQEFAMCQTPMYGYFNCAACNNILVERINNVLSCEVEQLKLLLLNVYLKNDLFATGVCNKIYGVGTNIKQSIEKDMKRSYYLIMLPDEYVGALCQLIAVGGNLDKIAIEALQENATNEEQGGELPLNLTIDKKLKSGDIKLLEKSQKKLINPNTSLPANTEALDIGIANSNLVTESAIEDVQQLPKTNELENFDDITPTTLEPETTRKPPHIPDVNIFNVPAADEIVETEITINSMETPNSAEQTIIATTTAATATTTTTTTDTITTATTISNSVSHMDPIGSAAVPTKSEEDSNSWDNIENLLTSATVPSTIGTGSSSGPSHQNGINFQHKIPSSPQSESIFIRLSNRIKALERNMSLSGQYLEELSRRYKKQVEELQQSLTQQIQIVRTLEEQNRRNYELEQLYALHNARLKEELADLTLQVHACIVVIIFVGAFVFLVLMVGILLYRSMRRDTKEIRALKDGESKRKIDSNTIANTKKIHRRKSFEDFSDRQQYQNKGDGSKSITDNISDSKQRRPSEEAMLILKESKDEKLLGRDETLIHALRQRKISVCYDSPSLLNASSNISGSKSTNKRRNEKHSWPNSVQSQQKAWHHLEELSSREVAGDSCKVPLARLKKPPLANGGFKNQKKKRELQNIKRPESAPSECLTPHETSTLSIVDDTKTVNYNETLMLDEDDLDNFIPNTDLVYNEFMPEGPRGHQCNPSNLQANNPASKKPSKLESTTSMNKKSRRLSSPAFFKSPFTKSLKGKISTNKSNAAHESTSWEWYRLKKSASSSSATQNSNTFVRNSPNASLDSSSLSEINFPTNSTENSFRILEEAILSSGESAITSPQSEDLRKS